MGINQRKIAVLCNYELLPERVGGMDYFFWLFDAKCKENNIQVDWFFPNTASHGDYHKLTIIASNYEEVEVFFNRNYVNQNYSHIVTHFIELCTSFFRSIKQKGSAKVIAVDHNPRPLQGYSLKKRLQKKVKGILFSKYINVFVGVSDYSKNQMITEFGQQIKNNTIVIFNGIHIAKYNKKTDFNFNGKFIVASHLRKDKGIQDLIAAVNEVKKESSIPFTIDIYGKGDYQIALEKMINHLSLNSVFHFKGSVSNLHELYYRYDYLIHPSHGETFCYSVVESLMSNLPVITTKHQGNVLQLVEENKNGFLFEEKNSNQLKEIILKIISDEVKIEDFSKDTSKIKELTIQNMVENHFNLIR
jgi:glycosyltransferase involved in cell wall biosynthesis